MLAAGQGPLARFSPGLLLAALAVGPYIGVLRNDFAGDDVLIVVQDPRVRSLAALPRLFTGPYWIDPTYDLAYRPLVQASYALQHVFIGPGPLSFHVVNLLFHAIVCVLLWRLALVVGAPGPAALLAAALFAVHPVHVEAVAQVVGRAELLAAAGVLGALLAHAGAPDRARRPALAAALFLLALGSKENGAVFLLLAPLLDAARAGRAGRVGKALRDALPAYAVYACVAAAYLLARHHALHGLPGAFNSAIANPIHDVDTGVRVATALAVLGRAVRLLVFPLRLSADYGPLCTPIRLSLLEPAAFFGLACAASCAAAMAISWRRSGVLFFALGLAALAYAPVSNLAFPIGTIFGERFLYLPSAGALLVAALVVNATDEKLRTRGIARGLWVVAIGLLSILTAARVTAWRTSETIYAAAERVCPRNVLAHMWLAHVAVEQGRNGDAIRHYAIARDLMPSHPRLSYLLGTALEREGRLDEAERLYGETLFRNAGDGDAANALASLLERKGDLEGARRVRSRAGRAGVP